MPSCRFWQAFHAAHTGPSSLLPLDSNNRHSPGACCHFSLQDAFGAQPIRELLAAQGLDAQLQQALLHGVLLLDSCPPCGGSSGGGGSGAHNDAGAMAASDALERLRMFVQSAGRYGSGTGGARQLAPHAFLHVPALAWLGTLAAHPDYLLAKPLRASLETLLPRLAPLAGPFLTPLYGCGELPQAFSRTAAVAGAVQVLRCGLAGLSFDEHTFSCDGVELASGQVRAGLCGMRVCFPLLSTACVCFSLRRSLGWATHRHARVRFYSCMCHKDFSTSWPSCVILATCCPLAA